MAAISRRATHEALLNIIKCTHAFNALTCTCTTKRIRRGSPAPPLRSLSSMFRTSADQPRFACYKPQVSRLWLFVHAKRFGQINVIVCDLLRHTLCHIDSRYIHGFLLLADT